MMSRLYTLFIFITVVNLSFGQLSKAQKDSILSLHNYYRQIVGSPKLSWSSRLEKKAKQWADEIAKHPLVTHNSFGYGQNLFYTDDTAKFINAVNYWAKEQIFYHGQKITNDNLLLFKHYTQIIWYDTRFVGCDYSKLPSGMYVLVCFYEPPGNIIGQRPTQR